MSVSRDVVLPLKRPGEPRGLRTRNPPLLSVLQSGSGERGDRKRGEPSRGRGAEGKDVAAAAKRAAVAHSLHLVSVKFHGQGVGGRIGEEIDPA